MENLIAALNIFLKYGNSAYPTNCSHDVLAIMNIEEDDVSDEDKAKLDKLGFFWSNDDECFISFYFGSA